MVLVLILLMLATGLGGEAARNLLEYRSRAILDGQIWRVLTGNFVHLGWYHWGLNVAALLIFATLCPQPAPAWEWALRDLALCLGVGLGLLLFDRRLGYYVGMSGMVHGLFVLGLLPQVLRRDRVALACLLFLVGKLAYEQLAGAPLSDEQAIGGKVITDAHLWGAVTGVLYFIVARPLGGGRQRHPLEIEER